MQNIWEILYKIFKKPDKKDKPKQLEEEQEEQKPKVKNDCNYDLPKKDKNFSDDDDSLSL